MKSIQQTCQLSDRELKAVLRGEEDFYGLLEGGRDFGGLMETAEAFSGFAAFWSVKYKGMAGMLRKTDAGIFTYYSFPGAIRKSVYTSNTIESLNAKLKREMRKRIPANSEVSATNVSVDVFLSYGKSAGHRVWKKGIGPSKVVPICANY